MLSIELRPELADELQAEAARLNTTIQDLVNEWLAQDLWEQRNEKIRHEAKLYRSQHVQLREQYADKFIAMLDGQVVESGDDMLKVYRRVQERFGDAAVLITEVSEEPYTSYMIRGIDATRVTAISTEFSDDNPSEEELEAEDKLWEQTFERHADKFAALLEEAKADIVAGRTIDTFDENGEFALN